MPGASWSSQAGQLRGQPARSRSGPSAKAWVRAVAAVLRNSRKEGERGGTLAESLPIEFSRMVALISLVLFALIFHPGLHWTESGVEGEIAQGQYLDELLVSQVALYKLATAL